MSGLLFLTTDDFKMMDDGKLFGTNIPGLSLVLFYSTECPYSAELVAVFKRLIHTVSGCKFGMVNVSTNSNIVQMSANTILPIEYVPLTILCVKGKPWHKYDGPRTDADISRFIGEMSQTLERHDFGAPAQPAGAADAPPHGTKKEIPAYCTGNPLCGGTGRRKGKREDICYLDFDKCYGGSCPVQQPAF